MKNQPTNNYLSPQDADGTYGILPEVFQARVRDPGGFADPMPRIFHAHAKAFRKKRGKPRPNTKSLRRDWRTDGRIGQRLDFRRQQTMGIIVDSTFSERAKRHKVHGPLERGRESTWRRRRRFDTRRPRERVSRHHVHRVEAGLKRKDDREVKCSGYPFEVQRGVTEPIHPPTPNHEGYNWSYQEMRPAQGVLNPFGHRTRRMKRYSGFAWRFRQSFWRFRPYRYFRSWNRMAFQNTSLRWDGADRTFKHTTQPVRVKCYADGPGPQSFERKVLGKPKWKKGIFARRCWRGKRNYRMGAPSWSLRWGVQNAHGVLGRSHFLRKHRDHAFAELQPGRTKNGGYAVPATRVTAWHAQSPDKAPFPYLLPKVAAHQTDDDFQYPFSNSNNSAFPFEPSSDWQTMRPSTVFGPRPLLSPSKGYMAPLGFLGPLAHRRVRGNMLCIHGTSQVREHWGAWDKPTVPGTMQESWLGPGVILPQWAFDDRDRVRRFPLEQPWINPWPASVDRDEIFPSVVGDNLQQIYQDPFGAPYQLHNRAGAGDNQRWFQECRALVESKSRWRLGSRLGLHPLVPKSLGRHWYSFRTSGSASTSFEHYSRSVQPIQIHGLEFRQSASTRKGFCLESMTPPGRAHVAEVSISNQLHVLEWRDGDWVWPEGFDYSLRDDILHQLIQSYRGPTNFSALEGLVGSPPPVQLRPRDRVGRQW